MSPVPPAAAVAETLTTAFLAGVEACHGTKRVKAHIRSGALDDWFGDRFDPRPIRVIALGKAAPAMMWGLVEANVPFTGIGVTTEAAVRPSWEGFTWHIGDHPRVGLRSLAAGVAVQDWIESIPDDRPVLALLSGGASALVEAGMEVADAQRLWDAAAGDGADIEALNEARRKRSSIKAGGLATALLPRVPDLRVWLLGDTPPGTEQRLVASGPFDHPKVDHTVLATNENLVGSTASMLQTLGHSVYLWPGRISGPTEAAVDEFLAGWQNLPPGSTLVGGGETTVALPPDAPAGGRCHHAALAAATSLPDDAVFFAAGSDGRDGTSEAAGAWSTAADADPQTLAAFAAAQHLHGRGRSVRTGVTGTNVNDVWIAAPIPA